jgi:hypothetical protein
LLLVACWRRMRLTSHWDLHYASGKRFVGAFEQTMHAYLEALPLVGLRTAGGQLLASIHRDIRGIGSVPDWRWAWKSDPLPTSVIMPYCWPRQPSSASRRMPKSFTAASRRANRSAAAHAFWALRFFIATLGIHPCRSPHRVKNQRTKSLSFFQCRRLPARRFLLLTYPHAFDPQLSSRRCCALLIWRHQSPSKNQITQRGLHHGIRQSTAT